jgi:hypothetical protein
MNLEFLGTYGITKAWPRSKLRRLGPKEAWITLKGFIRIHDIFLLLFVYVQYRRENNRSDVYINRLVLYQTFWGKFRASNIM